MKEFEFFKESDCDFCTTFGRGITVSKANALIKERGRVVASHLNSCRGPVGWHDWVADATHTALLICIEEIQKDSAEKLISDLGKFEYDLGTTNVARELGVFVYRARKLLSRGDGSHD